MLYISAPLSKYRYKLLLSLKVISFPYNTLKLIVNKLNLFLFPISFPFFISVQNVGNQGQLGLVGIQLK